MITFIIMFSLPAAWGLEELLVMLVAPPMFRQLRGMFRPWLTTIVWYFVFASVLAGLMAFPLQRWWIQRNSRHPRIRRAGSLQTEAFLVASSVAQLPAVLAIIAALLGAAPIPVALTVSVSSIGVLGLGFYYVRLSIT